MLLWNNATAATYKTTFFSSTRKLAFCRTTSTKDFRSIDSRKTLAKLINVFRLVVVHEKEIANPTHGFTVNLVKGYAQPKK